jgi:flagellar hook-length control protein FliK
MSNANIEPVLVVSRTLPETSSPHATPGNDGRPAFERHLSLAGSTTGSKRQQDYPSHADARRDDTAHSEGRSDVHEVHTVDARQPTGSHAAQEPYDEALSHHFVSIPQITNQRALAAVAVASVAVAGEELEPTVVDTSADAEQIVLANNNSDVAVHVEVVVNDQALLTARTDDEAQVASRKADPNRYRGRGTERATAADDAADISTQTGERPIVADAASPTAHQVGQDEQQPTREDHLPHRQSVDTLRESVESTNKQAGNVSREPSLVPDKSTETVTQSTVVQAAGKTGSTKETLAAQREQSASPDTEAVRRDTDTSAAADELNATSKNKTIVAVQQAKPSNVERPSRSPSEATRAARPANVQPIGDNISDTGRANIALETLTSKEEHSTAAKIASTLTDAEPPTVPNGPSSAPLVHGSRLLPGGERAAANDELPRVNVDRFLGRVTRAFQTAQQRGGVLQLRLSPPELGSLRVEITLHDGVMSASLETETAAARRLLLDNLPALRDRLAEQNVRVDRFDVDVRRDDGGGQTELGPRYDRRQAPSSAPPRRNVRPAATTDESTTPSNVPRSISSTRINVVA